MPKTCYDCYFCRTYNEPNQGYFCIPLFADLHRTDFTKKRIDACPLIEIQDKCGKWSDKQKAYRGEYGDVHFGYQCSVCGAIVNKANYCGACGAKMKNENG